MLKGILKDYKPSKEEIEMICTQAYSIAITGHIALELAKKEMKKNYFNISKAKKLLGYKPKYNLVEGIIEMKE